jgi:SAM-dependent methyltransferase
MSRAEDGSAGDADYGLIGQSYSSYRRPEPRIAVLIEAALGSARAVLNVGAGAGSYEPLDRDVTPVEPSASMRAQRPDHLAVAVDATAEDLPFPDNSFDAALSTFSVHQWSDVGAGLREVRRVTRGPVVLLTCDPDLPLFWLNEYAPEVISVEARRYPPLPSLGRALGGTTDHTVVPVPWTASTVSTRRTTGGRRRSWTGRRAWPAPPGASSNRPDRIASSNTCGAISPTGPGTDASDTCGPNQPSMAHSSWWYRSRRRCGTALRDAVVR